MECESCGASEWRPHGSYRTSDGVRVRRFRCAGCGRTRSERTGTPSYRLKRGAETVGTGLSRYLSFFSALARTYPRAGLTRAIAQARRRAEVSKATASRWLADADIVDLGAQLAERARSRQITLGLPPAPPEADSDDDPTPSARWEVLAECLGQYRERRPASRPGEALAGPRRSPVESADFLRLVVRARSVAAIRRGEPFPSWLDRVAPVAEPTRRFAFPSEWRVLLSTADTPWLLLERVAGGRWRSGTVAREAPGEPWELLQRWCRARVLDGWREVGGPGDDGSDDAEEPSWRDVSRALRSAMGGAGGAEARERFRRRVERLHGRNRPDRLRKKDEKLDGPLRYWVRCDGERVRVEVATRRRVVGTAAVDVADNGEPDAPSAPFGPVWFHPVPVRERPDPGELWLSWVGKKRWLKLEAPSGAFLAAERRR